MFTTEFWGNALAIMSATRVNDEDEPQVLGIASVDKTHLSDGNFYIRCNIEIRPYCEPGELMTVKQMLIEHVQKGI